MRAADLPLLAPAIRGQDERSLSRAYQYSYTTHRHSPHSRPGAAKPGRGLGTVVEAIDQPSYSRTTFHPLPPLSPGERVRKQTTSRRMAGRPSAHFRRSPPVAAGQHDDQAEYPTDQHVDDLRSEEHTSELQSLRQLVCRLLLEK